MQLTLFESSGEYKPQVFLDVYAKMLREGKSKHLVLKAIEGQTAPSRLKIRCFKKALTQFPEGTIYKLDVKLVRTRKNSPYLTAVNNRNILRAVEFFEYNVKIQKSQNNP